MKAAGDMTTGADDQRDDYHVPVLLAEVLEGLAIRPGGTYVDCTFGGGGHSKAILARLNESGRMVVFDQDPNARRNLPDDHRISFVPQNFRHLQRFLRLEKIETVDGILADLGVSSHQFNEADRGFSTRFDGPLDMRMDNRREKTAATVLNTFTEPALHKLFEKYGEVTNSKTLAGTIVRQRLLAAFETIGQFKEAIRPIVKGNPNKYMAQVFQALRIEVNDELGALQEMMQQSVELLKPGGRIAIISFHSLEDRLVKTFFKQGNDDEEQAGDLYGNRAKHLLKPVNKKPIVPGEKELKMNSRSRSAKLRIAEKIQG